MMDVIQIYLVLFDKFHDFLCKTSRNYLSIYDALKLMIHIERVRAFNVKLTKYQQPIHQACGPHCGRTVFVVRLMIWKIEKKKNYKKLILHFFKIYNHFLNLVIC